MKKLILMFAGLAIAACAVAQELPRTIRLVVAYPVGGTADAAARALADQLGRQLGRTVIVENKAGASGAIGLDAVAKAPPDGATLGFCSVTPLALSPHLGRMPFDPRKDLQPVASVMASPVLLLSTPADKSRDFAGLLNEARARPGALRWATSGPTSLGRIMLEQLRAAAKVDITHVPYKGGGQQLTDALSGQFEVLSINAGPSLAAPIHSGQLRPLAVGAPARIESLPQVPTLAELGYREANQSSLFGVFAPARTPAALLARYNAEINKALANADLHARLVAAGNVPTGGTAAAFGREIEREYESDGRIVQAAHIQAD